MYVASQPCIVKVHKHMILCSASLFNIFSYFLEFFQGKGIQSITFLCSQIALAKPGMLNMQGCHFKGKDVELFSVWKVGNGGG